MSEPQNRLRAGLIRSFKLLVDRLDPADILPGCVQRRILPLSEMERLRCETRAEGMMRLLGKLYRQSFVDPSTLEEFVDVLAEQDSRDSGYRYSDVIETIAQTQPDGPSYRCIPFSETDIAVFDCTRRVAENCLEPHPILPELVSKGVITPETCDEVLRQSSRSAQMHHLMHVIRERGILAFKLFAKVLLSCEDRLAKGVGDIIHKCLLAHQIANEEHCTKCKFTTCTHFALCSLQPFCIVVYAGHNQVLPTAVSKESQAFRRAFSELFTLISNQDPQLTLVNHLYSCYIIDKSSRDSIMNSSRQRVEQVRLLLQILENMVESDSKAFHDLTYVLEKGRFFEFATSLKNMYGKEH